MAKRRKQTLFKRDIFNIKEKLFFHRITKSMMKRHQLIGEQLASLLNMATLIGIPRDEEDTKRLEWICTTYDSLLKDINNEMNRAKERIREESIE